MGGSAMGLVENIVRRNHGLEAPPLPAWVDEAAVVNPKMAKMVKALVVETAKTEQPKEETKPETEWTEEWQ